MRRCTRPGDSTAGTGGHAPLYGTQKSLRAHCLGIITVVMSCYDRRRTSHGLPPRILRARPQLLPAGRHQCRAGGFLRCRSAHHRQLDRQPCRLRRCRAPGPGRGRRAGGALSLRAGHRLHLHGRAQDPAQGRGTHPQGRGSLSARHAGLHLLAAPPSAPELVGQGRGRTGQRLRWRAGSHHRRSRSRKRMGARARPRRAPDRSTAGRRRRFRRPAASERDRSPASSSR